MKLHILCDTCLGRGWVFFGNPAIDLWAEYCPDCGGFGEFREANLAKILHTSPDTVARLYKGLAVRSTTAYRILENLARHPRLRACLAP